MSAIGARPIDRAGGPKGPPLRPMNAPSLRVSVARDLRQLFQIRDLLVEKRRRDDAVVEVREIELLVRRVRVLVGQPHAEQHAR